MWGLLQALLASVVFGAMLHLLYDGMRLLRALGGERFDSRPAAWLRQRRMPGLSPALFTRPPRKGGERLRTLLLITLDLLFMAAAGLLFSVFVYWQNDGQLRAMFLVGVFLGFFAWHVTLGRFSLAVSELLALLLRVLLAYLLLGVRVPLLFAARLLLLVTRWLRACLARLLLALYERVLLAHYSRREEARRLRSVFRDLPL